MQLKIFAYNFVQCAIAKVKYEELSNLLTHLEEQICDTLKIP